MSFVWFFSLFKRTEQACTAATDTKTRAITLPEVDLCDQSTFLFTSSVTHHNACSKHVECITSLIKHLQSELLFKAWHLHCLYLHLLANSPLLKLTFKFGNAWTQKSDHLPILVQTLFIWGSNQTFLLSEQMIKKSENGLLDNSSIQSSIWFIQMQLCVCWWLNICPVAMNWHDSPYQHSTWSSLTTRC